MSYELIVYDPDGDERVYRYKNKDEVIDHLLEMIGDIDLRRTR